MPPTEILKLKRLFLNRSPALKRSPVFLSSYQGNTQNHKPFAEFLDLIARIGHVLTHQAAAIK